MLAEVAGENNQCRLVRCFDALAAKLDQAAESTLENTLAAVPNREMLHPGVLRYMREIGLA